MIQNQMNSKIASASVGHWLSLLFKAADNEAARGHLGNVKLRIEAFTMLRVLVGMAVGRCLCLVSNVVQICGGGFFSQRFRTDGSHFWKLLSTSPFHRNPKLKEERIPLQLPYRSRVAVLNMASPPTAGMPEISEILLPSSSLKEYLYVQYGGQSYGFDINLDSVEI
ncbi:hypothetical protein DVH24_021876 [Malus domestica]|uniref:Uncharacterized protein n=1 Tax=Malus domestica TaxID=3750 RepID=A0A498IYP1_MALDO|nr:hypothetical protein DVH24_021876 [Malus domestica]